ncbi:MAG: hypothetical protein M1839_005285 [Geoglossum umbratile]|nr:MAG: hypothetical protein M1839_005285 [Geoglossum umbratile]
MSFPGTHNGNTVVWQFLNQAATSPGAWARNTTATAPTQIMTTSSPTQEPTITISSPTQEPTMTTSSPIQEPTMSSAIPNTKSPGLSVVASAGIAIGSTVVVLLAALLVVCLLRRPKRVMQASGRWSGVQAQPEQRLRGDQNFVSERQSLGCDLV